MDDKEVAEWLNIEKKFTSEIHHCPDCGWTPGEGMEKYLHIHGKEARCIRCKVSLPGSKALHIVEYLLKKITKLDEKIEDLYDTIREEQDRFDMNE